MLSDRAFEWLRDLTKNFKTVGVQSSLPKGKLDAISTIEAIT